jgi:hypothetical protein
MKMRELFSLGRGFKAGNWVEFNGMKGIFIVALSNDKNVVATWKGKNKKYMTVNTKDLKKIDRPKKHPKGLVYFARKHLLWTGYRGKKKKK